MDDASELMRLCMDRRFLLADGVFELSTVSHDNILISRTTYLVLEGMWMPRGV
jgi:hypothetical protein